MRVVDLAPPAVGGQAIASDPYSTNETLIDELGDVFPAPCA